MPEVILDIRSNQRTGVSRYGSSIAAALCTVDAGTLRFIVLAGRDQPVPLAPAGAVRAVLREPAGDGFVRRSDWVLRQVDAIRPDLYVTTHYAVDRRLGVPFVPTIHDLNRLRFPQHAYTRESVTRHYGPGEWDVLLDELRALADWDDGAGPTFMRYFWALNRYLFAHSRAVFTVSKTTIGHIVELLGTGPTVHVVSGGVDRRLFRPSTPERVRAVRQRYAGGRPYCMYVGLAGPTKRFPWLLDVLLRHGLLRGPAGHGLVVAGGHAERRPEVQQLLAHHGAARWAPWVRFTGYVPDVDLVALYSGAQALLVPSISEGYHLPTGEALSCGCEVIATDIPVLRETTGGHAHFFPADGSDAEAWLARLVTEAFAGRLPPRAPTYRAPTWSRSADRLVRAVRLTLGQG